MHQVPDCHPSPFYFSKKCRLGSKFTVRALLCAPSASLRFRLSYFQRPSRRSFSRANSASFKRSKTDRRNPERRTCSVFAILPSQEITTRRNYNATQRWQKNVAQLLAMAVRAELLSEDWSRLRRLRRRVVGRSKPSTFPWRLCRLSFLQKKKKKKRAISPPEVILPSFKRAISLPEVVLPKKGSLQGNIGQSGPVFRASDWSLP